MQPLLLVFMFLLGIWPVVQQASGWREYVSNEGKFAATLPANVNTNMVLTNISKARLQTYMVSANDSDLNEYLVSWTEYAEGKFQNRDLEKTLNRMRDALVQTKNGKILAESPVSLGSHTGREITFSTPEGRLIRVRFYFVTNRVYQVLAETWQDKSKINQTEDAGVIDRFFNSFRLLPATLV